MPGVILPSRSARLERWRADVGEFVTGLDWDPNGERLAVGTAAGEVLVLNSSSGSPHQRWLAHVGGILGLEWCPGESLLATAGQDGLTRLWNPTTAEELHAFPAAAAWVEHLAWSPGGEYLATAAGKHLSVWARGGELKLQTDDHESTISGLAWGPLGRSVATACYGVVRIRSLDPGAAAGLLPWKTSLVALAWSPDGRWMAAGTQDQSVHIWPVPFQPEQDLEMQGYPLKVRLLAWDRRSRLLVTAGSHTPTVWDFTGRGPAESRPMQLVGHRERVTAFAYQRAGELLASADQSGMVGFWNPGRGPKLLSSGKMDSEVVRLVWSPTGGRIALGTASGSVAVWRTP